VSIPHAFGGALAVGYCVLNPRATGDIDVNVFVRVDEVPRLFAALPSEITIDDDTFDIAIRDGKVRVRWEKHPVDLFFSYHPLHDRAQTRVNVVPFGDHEIPVLSCTDLAVFKVVFNRTRDWADLEAMIEANSVDRDDAHGWLRDVLGSDAGPVQRFETLEPHDDATAESLRNALGTPAQPRRGPPESS
jgi:hypothetical protein